MKLIMLAALVGCTDVEPIDASFHLSNSRLELGPVACGMTASKSIRVDNPDDQDVVIAIESNNSNIVVPAEVEVRAFSSAIVAISSTIHESSNGATITFVAGDQTREIVVTTIGLGVPVTFDPPVVDFGTLLPNTTKELPLQVTLGAGAGFAMNLALGPASTPRFEIVGATTARLDPEAPRATFTLRYLSSTTPFEHAGELPVVITGAGTCAPPEIRLTGTTVP